MKYATVCSGIEAPTVAWEPMGWEAQWFSEVAPFPSAVLAHHWPAVPNLGDMTKIYQNEIYNESNFDVLVGGTPCQGFSLAGKRGGLDDERSQLVWHFLRILDEKRPRWMVWENVPGVLSSWSDAAAGEDGTVWQTNDFDQFAAAIRQLGYGLAMRVLDAQYFGVAQRRQRVFVVGYLGDWRPATAVLFERQSCGGHPPPSRETGQEAAHDASNGIGASSETAPTLLGKNGVRLIDQVEAVVVQEVAGTLCKEGPDNGQSFNGGHLIVTRPLAAFHKERQMEVAAALLSNMQRNDLETQTFLVEETANCLTATAHKGGQSTAGNNPGMVNPIICFQQNTRDEVRAINGDGQIAGCLAAQAGMKQQNYLSYCIQPNQFAVSTPRMKVRRLTPIEYERLMGFRDGHTRIPYRGKPAEHCPDGPRYAACGNSIAVPVLRWLGERIERVDKIVNPKS